MQKILAPTLFSIFYDADFIRVSAIAFASALLAGLTTQASAQTTVFSDDFTDKNRAGWYIFNQGVDADARSLDISRGFMETFSSDDFNRWGVVANFASVDLSADGDFIKLSLDFQIFEDLGSRTMTIGLYDSNGTLITADINSFGNGSDDSGYWLYNREADYILKSGAGTGLGDTNGNTSLGKKIQPSPFATADSIWHTVSLSITKSGADLLVELITDEGLASETVTSATNPTERITRFDQIVIQAITQDFAIDNVVVEKRVSIPEPSSFALLAGILGLFSVMRGRCG